jgi:predicted small lipoprotein YifL
MTTQEMNTNITNTNESAEKKTNKKKAIGIVAVAAVTVAAVIIAMLTACGNKQPVATADEVIGTSVQTVTQVVTDSQGNTHIEEATKVVEVKQTQPADKSEKATEVNAQNAAKTDNKQNNGGQSNNNSNGNSNQTNNNNNNGGNGQTSKSNGSSGSTNKPASNSGSSSSSSQSKPSGGSSSSSSQSKPSSGSGSSSSSKPAPAPATQPATKDPHEGKTWHDAEYKTEKVWVVDEEGYTWQCPIYEDRTVTICNICGAEITGNVQGHDEAVHLPNGDDFSYRVETVSTIVGYETETVPEKGHYETKTTLVRAAGWY